MKNIRKIQLLAVFFVIMVILAMPITAHAESIYIESQGITVQTKETPTKTVVKDARGVLSDEQIKQVEAAGERLKIYDVGLYVEMTEKASCSQKYANNLAEQKFDELLNGKENSIMIVFTFYEDAGGYYAIHYDIQGNMSENQVNRIIQGSYHDFKTDATWIAGSFDQVIDYLSDVEYSLIHADEIAKQEKESLHMALKVFRIILEIFAVVIIIYLIRKNSKDAAEWDELDEKKEKKINNILEDARKKKQMCKSLSEKCNELQKWKDNAIACTPGVEANVTEYLAKERANEFDETFKETKEFPELVQMIFEYDEMSTQEKEHVKIDVKSARARLEKMAKAEAKKATKVIEETCKKSADRHNRDSYNSTLNYYNGLPHPVRILIAAQLIKKLNDGNSAAQSDYRHYHNMHSSSYRSSTSSFRHSSGGFHSGTFGGGFHGGH